MMTMSGQQEAAGPTTHYFVADCGSDDLLEVFGGRHSSSSDDLFELVRQGVGSSGSRKDDEVRPQPAAGGGVLASPLPAPPDHRPPSDEEMAAWLRPIVRGDVEPSVVGLLDHAGGHTTAKRREREVSSGSSRKRGKQRGRDTRSHHSETHSRGSSKKETHNRAEKRRRWKTNESFKILQQFVPGCDDKSNQSSTLDKTIQYMKSLQQQIQAMSYACSMVPAAVYPVLQAPPYLPPPGGGLLPPASAAVTRLGPPPPPPPPPAMAVPFAPMLPAAAAVMVHNAAPMPLQYVSAAGGGDGRRNGKVRLTQKNAR